MKKLTRLKLTGNAEFMNEDEMKMIVGGAYAAGDCDTHGATCSGECYITDTLIKGECDWLELNGYKYCACQATV